MKTEHDNDVGRAEVLAGWDAINTVERVTVTYAVIGLTNFGERPVRSTRLAEVLGRTVNEVEALAQQWGWPGTRVEDGLVSVDPERAKSATRRRVQVGDHRFGVTGCGPDILMYAPLVRPSLHLEETCVSTGTPIRIVFTPAHVERVDPSGAVLAMPHPREFDKTVGACDVEDVDASHCVQSPLFSSAEAARGWLADHPGGRVFSLSRAWDLSPFRDWRDRMSTLLDLDN